MLGTIRTSMTHVARTCVYGERHLASWERFLAEAQWHLPGLSQTVVTQLQQQPGGLASSGGMANHPRSRSSP
jgi:hypothetical protein